MIDRVFTKYPFFGSRQIAAYLPQSGFSAGRHRVRRLITSWGCRPSTCPAVHVYMHERVQGADHPLPGNTCKACVKRGQEAPTASHLSIPAEEAPNHAALDKRTPDIAYFGHAEIRKAA